MSVLKRGSTGEAVVLLQQILGVDTDGIFGAATEAAVVEHQHSERLTADGIAGPDTLATLGMWNHITLQQGNTGLTVKKLQAALGVAEDGVFGPDTTQALMAFQEEQGIAVDGVVGPVTLYHLNLFT